MKIDRRCFLSFVLGGAAGTALTPLPWKITDDISIWSQNWPWTPVPAKGEKTYSDSVCTLCRGGCGISVRKIDERAVKIEGVKGHPINDGGVCILGLSGLQLLYGPNRVKTPLKRTGNRGEGKWKAISWDEALSEVSQKMTALRKENAPHTLGCILGNRHGIVPALFQRLLTAFGSSNVMVTPSAQDSMELAVQVMHGVQATVGFDLENANYILSFGSGIVEGWGSPVRAFRANSAWRDKGATVVQAEPRLSNTAARADQWVPINAGTESALAMGMAHVIIKESLFNDDFVQNHSAGFHGWKQHVLNDFTPEKTAEITGLDASVIKRLARDFAKASHPLAICGRGQGSTPISLNDAMAVHALNALVGNINQPGGVSAVAIPSYIDWPEVKLDDIAEESLRNPRIDGAGGDKYPMAHSLLNRLADAVASNREYAMQALFVYGANPIYSMPGAEAFKAAVDKIPFVVSFASTMDETAMNADLVLPNHADLERYEDVPVTAGLPAPMLGLARPVVYPMYNTQHVGDVVIRLAQEIGGSVADAFPWDGFEACLEETLGDKWDSLNEEGYWLDSEFQPAAWKDAFETASGKFEFVNESMDLSPGYSVLHAEGDKAAYPLVLIPYDSMRLANGLISNPPFLVKAVDDTVLQGKSVLIEINPETAKSLELFEGKAAKLTTPKGEAEVRVHLYDGIMPGVIALPRGLGHTTEDKYIAGKGVNFNNLIGPVEDQASGLDAACGIRAKLAKA
jgi:anaerobic selenocysteine-containing dehydrogenase